MNWNALLGILLIVYAIACVLIALLKPEAIWQMKKIQGFVKVLKERGTVIFFIVWGAVALGFGLWLLIATPIG
jgi:hypothetical protein